METFLALVFLGSVFYSGKVILEYVSRLSDAAPRIDWLEHEAERLSDEAALELVRCTTVQDRLASVRSGLSGLRTRVRDFRVRVDAERTREKRLQVAIYRHRIQKSRRVLVP